MYLPHNSGDENANAVSTTPHNNQPKGDEVKLRQKCSLSCVIQTNKYWMNSELT